VADIKKAMGEAEEDREYKLAELRKQQIDELTYPLTSTLSDRLSRAMTGQKTDFGHSLENTGRGMLRSGLDKAMNYELGERAKPRGKFRSLIARFSI
jgi:hypothetical protein